MILQNTLNIISLISHAPPTAGKETWLLTNILRGLSLLSWCWDPGQMWGISFFVNMPSLGPKSGSNPFMLDNLSLSSAHGIHTGHTFDSKMEMER